MPEMRAEKQQQFHAMDYDDFQPYFIGHEENEEFYAGTPTPSEDIWKKFELLPTPPRSPGRPSSAEPYTYAPLPSEIAEQLQQVSDTLDDDNLTQTFVFPDQGNLKSKLIQDCMWSGGHNGAQPQQEETKTSKASNTGTPAAVASCLTPPPLDYNVADCVDPTAVFPYPLNDPKDQLGLQTPSDSEEEIDVVTVADKLHPPKRRIVSANETTSTQLTTANITLKRVRPSSLSNVPAKKSKQELTMAELKALMQQTNGGRRTPGNSRPNSRPSSRPSSDSEDNDKRATHNVLERKRRNDLKTSFLTLRDHVPELESQERAPKVVILRKATEHIQQIHADEQRLLSEKEKEKRRNALLLERLKHLRHK